MLRVVLDTSSLVSYVLTCGDIMNLLHMRSFRGVVIHNPGQFLLALELSMLDANAMAKRFDRGTLVDIQRTLLFEPETSSRLATAVDLTAREDGTT